MQLYPFLFSLCYISTERCAGASHILKQTKCYCLSQSQISSGMIINAFITSFPLEAPRRDVLFTSSVPTTHLNVLSSACSRAARRDGIYYWLPPHAHCLGNCLNCLPWPMCIWTDGKFLHSCQQESRDATKIHLELAKKKKKKNNKKNPSWEFTQVCCRWNLSPNG